MMTKRMILQAFVFLVALGGGMRMASAAVCPSTCFQKMGNDRVLLMNNDNNALCKVTLQSYYDTNVTQTTYWVHDGDVAPTGSDLSGENMSLLNLKDGTHHILWQRTEGDTGVSSNKLWELAHCRAGSAAPASSSNKDKRNYVPWSTVSLNIDTGKAMTAQSYKYAGMISMQNTLEACVTSPYYEDGIGTIYFDAVNGWTKNEGSLVLEVATETTDGRPFTSYATNLVWVAQKVDVLIVNVAGWGRNVSPVSTGSETISLACKTTGGSMGKNFYRIRRQLDWRKPVRFRIRRTTKTSDNEDSSSYLLLDNIAASYPPLDVAVNLKDKGLDETREKKRVLGWEGAFKDVYAFVGTSGATPWAEYACEQRAEVGKTFGTGAYDLSDILFHYRWTYLGIENGDWKTIEMQTSGAKDLVVKDESQRVDLSKGVGDIEFYYSIKVNSAPHYWPVDYALYNANNGTTITNTTTVSGTKYRSPYGSDWEEGGTPWTVTCRRDASEGQLVSGGTDWFVRVREGYTEYEDAAVVMHYGSGDGESTTNAWMELVDEHTWRLYYYMPTNAIGQKIRFHFAAYNRQYPNHEGFELNTNTWYLAASTINYLPYSGTANGEQVAELTLDGTSTHLLFEFNDSSGAYAVSHAAYQDFNLWTDSAAGYMGYYSTTAAVSEAKRTYTEDFGAWQVSSSANGLWHEDFNVSGEITPDSPYYPGTALPANTRTPHGWTANNGMFVCEAFTNTEEGLSLQMEGCGRGNVTLSNLSEDDVPNGIGAVEFEAAVAQPHAFDGFAWSMDGLKATNYAFTTKVELSTMCANDMSLADPSISLVGYYRPQMGCYEARARRVGPTLTELSIWKWEQQGMSMTCRQVGSRLMGEPPSGDTVPTTHTMFSNSDYNYAYWHTMTLSMCNTAQGTVVQARLARYQSEYDYTYDHPKSETGYSAYYDDQRYVIVTWTDTDSNRFTQGTYGMGTVNCAGYMGYPQLHNVSDPNVPTNFAWKADLKTVDEMKQEFDADDWVLPAGRYRRLLDKNEYGKDETPSFTWRPTTSASAAYHAYPNGWVCGLKGLVPEQTVEVKLARAGSSDSEWVSAGSTVLTNFQCTRYTFTPQVVYDAYVQLAAGGSSSDTRIDVIVDDIDVTAWRAGDYPNIGNNYGQKDDWVYTASWIENAVGVEGAYTVSAVPGTNEYCYVFTNAGKMVSFTPREDMYLAQALVVGGGGAGGWGAGGGGGGGGVYAVTNGVWLKAGEPVYVTVGAGGNNYFSEGTTADKVQRGDCGGESSLMFADREYVAYGGGGGGSVYYTTGYGCNNYRDIVATGGGQAANTYCSPTAGPTATGAAAAKAKPYGQGGGGGSGNSLLYVAGGGGGAGGNGINGITNNLEGLNSNHILMDLVAGDGGIGYASDITGTTEYYGGGGGGGDGLLYVSTGSGYTYDGHQYYGYYGSGSVWQSKYWMIRASDAKASVYGNRYPGAGGKGGGGAGAVRATTDKGEDGASGKGGGGGGGGCFGYSKYRPGGRGGDGAVILRIRGIGRNQCVIQPSRVEEGTPAGVRSPWLANGLSSFRFSYNSAHSNAVLLLQVSTNMTSYSELYNQTYEMTANWLTLTNFTFSSTNEASGSKSCYFSYRAPAHGAMRLIADPDVVAAAQAEGQDDPSYGSVALTSVLCYDEPLLDSRSWTGMNMWTVGWDFGQPHWTAYSLDGRAVTNSFAYLYDGTDGFSCSLNFSATLADNATGVTGGGCDLAEPEKTQGDNEYAKSYPYVQGPAMTNGIGYVRFRARRDNAAQATPSVVTLYGLPDPSTPEMAVELTNITVSADHYASYVWRSTEDQSGYMAMRLAVKGAAGEGGRDEPSELYYKDGKPIAKLQRVWLDDVAFSEPIAPRLALKDARPFRNGLTGSGIVSNILDVSEQPLIKESFGFQVRLEAQQLADDIDFSSIRVFVAYYPSTVPWGWRNWTNESKAVKAELTRVNAKDLVWRSMYENAASIAPGQSTPGTVVQYFFWTTYKDNSGILHSHEIDNVDWEGGPDWYWPVDYNASYGGGAAERFSPYTILDSISPKRAWINEVNYFDGYDMTAGYTAVDKQFIELAVPSGSDLTGWYLRVQNRNKNPVVLCTVGYDDITAVTTANMVNHYSFLTVASPKTVKAGTYTGLAGQWKSGSDLNAAEIYNGELSGNSPYAIELVRPSGVVEHQIVIEGTNYWAGKAWEWYGSGTNLCADLQAESAAGNTWFFAGCDDHDTTLGVYTNHGESASCWTNGLMATPTKVNQGQTIDPEWFLPPSSDFVWIYATMLGEHIYVVDGAVTNTSAVIMVGKGSNTNLLFTLDPWYQVASAKVAGQEVPGARGHTKTYTLPLVNVTNTTDVTAAAEVSAAITDRVPSTDPYFPAVCWWLMNDPDIAEGDIKPARFVGLSGAVEQELSLKQMYWLDIPPTEDGWVFRAGMGGNLVDKGVVMSQPCTPIPHTNAVTKAVTTNVRVTVFLQISNELTHVAYAPKFLQGLEPGQTSESYTGRPNWTSVTFQVTGALQNGAGNDTFIPLRWFVFGPESFGAPGAADAFTAAIEIVDPFSNASPAAHERWRDYPGTSVFYSWRLDDEPSNYSTEMLKKNMTTQEE